MSQRGLSQTSCLLMSIKLNGFYFTLSQKRQFLPQTLLNLLIDDIHIKREHVTKFLGVIIDENLSWKEHIEILSSKISKSIGMLYKSRDVLSKQCLKQLYFSFILSYVKTMQTLPGPAPVKVNLNVFVVVRNMLLV